MRIIQDFMRSFKVSRPKRSVVSTFIVLFALLLAACYDTSHDIGSDYLSDGQSVEMGQVDFLGYKVGSVDIADRIVSTKLFRSSRVASSLLTNGYFGAERNSVFGERRVGFYAQYTPGYYLDDEGFGYEPVVDSVMIYLNVNDYSGDTTVIHTYNVYEVLDDTFLTSSADSIFSADYQYPAGTIGSEPIFTFDFPDQANEVYVTSTAVRVRVESAGVDFLNRLMLKEGEDGTQIDYTYYNDDYDFDDFVDVFKGLYIVPSESISLASSGDDGATYSTSLEGSGFGFYGRSRYEEDPSIIADTVGMTYLFYDTNVTDVGSVSITTMTRDYSSSEIDLDNVSTADFDSDVHTSTVLVEGMGGIATQLILERALFEEFDRIIAEAEDDNYTTIFFNYARFMIYLESSEEYDEPIVLTPAEADELMFLPSRVGLYDTYSSFLDSSGDSEMETVEDYDTASEIYYSTVSLYDGSYNRSLGCYMLNVPLELQSKWTDYVEAKEAAGGDASLIDWEAQEWTKMIIAPLATDLFSPRYLSLQGEVDGVNKTPIRLSITYTLLK